MRERRRDYELMFIISPLRASEEEVSTQIDRLSQSIANTQFVPTPKVRQVGVFSTRAITSSATLSSPRIRSPNLSAQSNWRTLSCVTC